MQQHLIRCSKETTIIIFLRVTRKLLLAAQSKLLIKDEKKLEPYWINNVYYPHNWEREKKKEEETFLLANFEEILLITKNPTYFRGSNSQLLCASLSKYRVNCFLYTFVWFSELGDTKIFIHLAIKYFRIFSA